MRAKEVQGAVFEVPGDDAAAGAIGIHYEIDREIFDHEFGVVFERLLIERV